MEKKSKLITEENITMSDCLKATRSMRNCYLCKRENRNKDCKKCIPQVVIDELNTAIHAWFAFKKKSQSKKVSKSEETTSSDFDINYDF